MAVLTLKIISGQNVYSGKRRAAATELRKPEETHNGRGFYNNRDRPNVMVVFFDNLHFSGENHRDGTLPRNNLKGLITRIKEENRLHIPYDAVRRLPVPLGVMLTCGG